MRNDGSWQNTHEYLVESPSLLLSYLQRKRKAESSILRAELTLSERYPGISNRIDTECATLHRTRCTVLYLHQGTVSRNETRPGGCQIEKLQSGLFYLQDAFRNGLLIRDESLNDTKNNSTSWCISRVGKLAKQSGQKCLLLRSALRTL